MQSKNKDILDSVIYSYTADNNRLEEENKLLQETVNHLQQEIQKFKTPPLMVCDVRSISGDTAIIKIPNGNQFSVFISDQCENLRAGDVVLAEQKNLTVMQKIDLTKQFDVENFVIIEKPTVTWESIGGLKQQINEIKEVIELPLKKPKLFEEIGIKPPKGILLYGPPGTGKTLMAKAVAASTKSTFIEVVGSELVQKFIGEGAKLVKEIFELARQKGPSVVFIDEIDALAAKRMEVGTSGEREVNRTFMQLLAEIDGFKPLDNVKIIGATNRKDVLDPAILRPGRLDRLIYVPVPEKASRIEIFKIHSRTMPLDQDVNIESLVEKMEGFSGAEINAVCTEAGYFAIRENRNVVTKQDFLKAIDKVSQEEKLEGQDYMNMFG
ncbi:MAG: proteasome-activating nucleotidase [Nanoarchaeota archaeon]|nr:proteasome-activating nucleotidase [Nanoarchaeota archaeon]